jgi:hypothetical protein
MYKNYISSQLFPLMGCLVRRASFVRGYRTRASNSVPVEGVSGLRCKVVDKSLRSQKREGQKHQLCTI